MPKDGSESYTFEVAEHVTVTDETKALLGSLDCGDGSGDIPDAELSAHAAQVASALAFVTHSLEVDGVRVEKVEAYQRQLKDTPGHGAYDNVNELRKRLEDSPFYQKHGFALVKKYKHEDLVPEALILYLEYADVTLGSAFSALHPDRRLATNGENSFVDRVGAQNLLRGSAHTLCISTVPEGAAVAYATLNERSARLPESLPFPAASEQPSVGRPPSPFFYFLALVFKK